MNIILLTSIIAIVHIFITVSEKHFLKNTDLTVFMLLRNSILHMVFVLGFIIYNWKNGKIDISKYVDLINNKNMYLHIVIYCIILGINLYLHKYGVQKFDLSLFIPLATIIYVIGLSIFGIYYLKEPTNKYKTIGIILACISIYLINYTDSISNVE